MGDHSWNKENDTEKASVYYARAVHNNNHPEVLQVYFKKLDFSSKNKSHSSIHYSPLTIHCKG